MKIRFTVIPTLFFIHFEKFLLEFYNKFTGISFPKRKIVLKYMLFTPDCEKKFRFLRLQGEFLILTLQNISKNTHRTKKIPIIKTFYF